MRIHASSQTSNPLGPSTLQCFWADGEDRFRYLYCTVCITWPRAGSACAISTASPIDYVCLADRTKEVITGISVPPTKGGGSLTARWGPTQRYCQPVRWRKFTEFDQKASGRRAA